MLRDPDPFDRVNNAYILFVLQCCITFPTARRTAEEVLAMFKRV